MAIPFDKPRRRLNKREREAFPARSVDIHHTRLNDGRLIQFFANRETNLIVVDVVDASEKGGVEVYRRQV